MINGALTIILFLISLLVILPAPAFYFWLLAIAVDEYPWIFALISLVIIFVNLKSKLFPIATASITVLSLLIFLSPIVRACFVSKNLKVQMASSFGKTDLENEKPFSIAAMFKANLTVPYNVISYKKNGSQALNLDFYPSQIKGKCPCVIVIHGGSWKSGDSQQLPELNSTLAKNGYHVAAINYRLAPHFQNPAPVEDVSDALTFLKEKAGQLAIDTTNFTILGRSAGAQIALLAAYTLQDPSIKGVIDFYGPADMVWGYSLPSNPLIMDSSRVM